MKTAKWFTLVSNDSWIPGIEIHRVGKSSVRTSEMETIDPHQKGQEVQMRREALSVGWGRCGQNKMW